MSKHVTYGKVGWLGDNVPFQHKNRNKVLVRDSVPPGWGWPTIQ